MERYPKNNVTLGQDHGCACGSNCTCGTSCTCGPSDFKDAELYDFSFRRVPAEIIEWEEKERQERISDGVNPLLYAKLFRCQTELMHRNVPLSLLNDARAEGVYLKESSRGLASSFSGRFWEWRASFSSSIQHLIDSIVAKEAELEARAKPVIDNFDSKSRDFALATNQKLDNWKISSASLAHDAGRKMDNLKDSAKETVELVGDKTSIKLDGVKLKLNLGGDPSSRAAEEKERARRMDETVDPLVASRKGSVQRELIHSMKAN